MVRILRWFGIVLVVAAIAGCASSASPAPTTSASQPAAAPAASVRLQTASPSPTATPDAGAACAATSRPFDAKRVALTGAYAGDDGGIYYLRQLGTVLWWNGMSSRADPARNLGRDWNNVGMGQIKSDLTVAVDWADVPRGQILGHGTLTLKIEGDGKGNVQLRKVAETGTGFGNSLWTACAPG